MTNNVCSSLTQWIEIMYLQITFQIIAHVASLKYLNYDISPFYEWYVFSWHPPIIYVIFAKINFCRRRKNSFDHVDWVRRRKLLLSNFISNNAISFSIENICKQCDSLTRTIVCLAFILVIMKVWYYKQF